MVIISIIYIAYHTARWNDRGMFVSTNIQTLCFLCRQVQNLMYTSFLARHTFATYLLNKDIPIETVSRAMGHANIRQTQHYARMLGKKVVADMSKLLK